MGRLSLPKGKKGEEIAASFLKSKGYRVIDRNFKSRYGEIDIIALEGDFLVFIEVKTRDELFDEKPEEAMTPWKIGRLIKTAEYFKMKNEKLPEALRIDFVGITLSHGEVKDINLIKNITQ